MNSNWRHIFIKLWFKVWINASQGLKESSYLTRRTESTARISISVKAFLVGSFPSVPFPALQTDRTAQSALPPPTKIQSSRVQEDFSESAGPSLSRAWPGAEQRFGLKRRNFELEFCVAANLPLAARARVGHIDDAGEVAEWLKAALC
jgi:hypothetical protein